MLQIELWLVAVIAVIATIAIQLFKAWRETRFANSPANYNMGDFTAQTLEYYAGYDPTRPILISVQGKLYDVSSKKDVYGPGGPLHAYAGKECARALAKGSVDVADCNADVADCDLTEAEREKLSKEVKELEGFARMVGRLVPLKVLTLAELNRHDGTDPALPMLISIKGTVFDVSKSRDFYGPDGCYPFAGREVARAFALNSTADSDCTDNLEGIGTWELDNLKEWEAKFLYKYRVVGRLVKGEGEGEGVQRSAVDGEGGKKTD